MDHTDMDGTDTLSDLSTRFAELGDALREQYRQVSGDGAPGEAEIRDALRTLGSAAEAFLVSVGSALRDPAVRRRLKETAAGVVSALGATLEELGQELERIPDTEPTPAPETR